MATLRSGHLEFILLHVMQPVNNRSISGNLFERAKTLFPGGVNSPVRAFRSVHGPPLFIRKGDAAYMEDEDGNRYLDFCCSWGPLILGHNHPRVREAIIKTVEHGTSFGTPTKLGNEIGELIISNHRYIEQLRFVSSGTEAVMSAIRLARGYTGKDKILKFSGCYHGHADSLLVKAGSGLATFGVSTSAGIPAGFAQETLVAPLADPALLDSLFQAHASDLAAVIIEPIPANNGLLLQAKSYLTHLRELCTKHGVLLIFDEVISGFRVAFEGACSTYDIQPDICTFGKIIGGGMPVGAFAASKEIMQEISPLGQVYQAGTLSANPVAMAAGKAALEVLIEPGFYKNLNLKTSRFLSLLTKHIKDREYPMRIQHVGSIFWFAFGTDTVHHADQIDPEKMSHFKELHALLLDRGIYLGPSGYEVGFVSAAHTDADLQQAAEVICTCIDQIF